MINAFQFSWPAGNHVFTLQSHDFFPFSGYPYTVTLCFQPSLNSDPPGSALWFAPSRIVVYPIARAWLRGYRITTSAKLAAVGKPFVIFDANISFAMIRGANSFSSSPCQDLAVQAVHKAVQVERANIFDISTRGHGDATLEY